MKICDQVGCIYPRLGYIHRLARLWRLCPCYLE